MKQIPSSYRLKLAEAILLVNEWQDTGGSPELIRRAQDRDIFERDSEARICSVDRPQARGGTSGAPGRHPCLLG